MNRPIVRSFVSVALSTVVAVSFSFAGLPLVNAQTNWTAPTQDFPNGNVFPPLDTSAAAQTKTGGNITFGAAAGPGVLYFQPGQFIGVGAAVQFFPEDQNGNTVIQNARGDLEIPAPGGVPTPTRAGAIYYDVVSNSIKLYNGTAWVPIGAGGGGGGGAGYWQLISGGIQYASATNPAVTVGGPSILKSAPLAVYGDIAANQVAVGGYQYKLVGGPFYSQDTSASYQTPSSASLWGSADWSTTTPPPANIASLRISSANSECNDATLNTQECPASTYQATGPSSPTDVYELFTSGIPQSDATLAWHLGYTHFQLQQATLSNGDITAQGNITAAGSVSGAAVSAQNFVGVNGILMGTLKVGGFGGPPFHTMDVNGSLFAKQFCLPGSPLPNCISVWPGGGSGTSYWAANGNDINNTNSGVVGLGVAGTAAGKLSFYPSTSGSWFHIDNRGDNTLRISQGATPGATDLVTIDNQGNVGIGDTNPAPTAHFAVMSATDPVLALERSGAANPTLFKMGTDGALVVKNGGQDDVLVLKGGNVGIGTEAPPHALSILNGNIDLMRQPGNNVTPGPGPQLILESPGASLSTQVTQTAVACGSSGSPAGCPGDTTPSADNTAYYICKAGDPVNVEWTDVGHILNDPQFYYRKIICVAGSGQYSINTVAGTLEFTNGSGDVRFTLAQDGTTNIENSLTVGGLVTAKAGVSGIPHGMQVFNTPGSFTFTVPANVYSIKAEVWGGGGASGLADLTACGGDTPAPVGGGGGGGGAYVTDFINVTPGQSFSGTVGGGGTVYYAPIQSGQNSTFGSLTAGGGGNGFNGAMGGGTGGTASGGAFHMNGTNGAIGVTNGGGLGGNSFLNGFNFGKGGNGVNTCDGSANYGTYGTGGGVIVTW